MAPDYDDEDYFLPLEDQRVFGAGIRRKRVPFVPSSELNTTSQSSTSSSTNIADTYLSIVLKTPRTTSNTPTTTEPVSPVSASGTHSAPPEAEVNSSPPATTTTSPTEGDTSIQCEVCKLPVLPGEEGTSETTLSSRPHEASLAHQVCLSHSHPPSHLDRNRAGLRYLSTYGWDPDSRLGLGASGREGIREPLKGRIKNDTAGLGMGLDADGDRLPAPPPPPPKPPKLNAKQVRKSYAEARRKNEKVRDLFYQDDKILQYLGENA